MADLRPDQWVALAGTLLCALVLAGVYLRHPSTWCRWVASWTRREPDTYSVDHAARDLVAHARIHGKASALGISVVCSRKGGSYSVAVDGLTEAEAVRATSRVLRAIRQPEAL